jgi:hypothetical protein
VYVLDKCLQDEDSFPKWKARSWLGVYVGNSLAHAGNVPVIYNPITTHVSPQFHLVFDDQFTSIQRPVATILEAFFHTLFEKAHWEYKSTTDACLEDFYTFDTYWCHPPLSKRTYHASGSSSSPKTNKPWTSPSSLGPSSKYPDSFEAHLSDFSIKDRSTIPYTPEIKLKSTTKEPQPIKLNLVTTNSQNINFHEWKEKNGIQANVYNVLNPTAHLSHMQDNNFLINDGQPDLNLSSYAHAAETIKSAPVTVSASNIEDVLTQSQMIKSPDKEQFIVTDDWNKRIIKIRCDGCASYRIFTKVSQTPQLDLELSQKTPT